MYAPNLNVPLPDPSQLAPEQTAQQPDRMQQALSLITPLFALGTAMGGSPQAGASFLHGAHQTLQRQDQERQVKAHQDAQIAQQQAQLAAVEQYRQQQIAQKEAEDRNAFVMSTQKSLQGVTDKNQWEQQLAFAENVGQQFYGLRPNALRGVVRYYAPDAKQKVADTLKAFVSNPLNKGAIETGQNLPSFSIDTDADGVPDKPLSFAEAADYVKEIYPLAVGPNGGIMPAPKNTNPDKFDLALQIETDNFTADKGHPPQTPKEKGIVYDLANKRAKTPSDPPQSLNINLPGMSPEDRVKGAAQAILEHRLAPSQISQVFGGGMGKEAAQFKQAVTAEVMKQNPTFNFQEAESGYQFGKSTGTQTTVRMIDNIMHTLPVLEKASDDFKRSGVRMINKATLGAKSQFGDTTVAQFEAARLGLADEVAKILSGGGTGNSTSDAKLKQANELLAADMTPGQLKATIAMVKQLLSTRRGSLTSGTYMDNQDTKNPDAGVEVWIHGPNGKLIKKGGGNAP